MDILKTGLRKSENYGKELDVKIESEKTKQMQEKTKQKELYVQEKNIELEVLKLKIQEKNTELEILKLKIQNNLL